MSDVKQIGVVGNAIHTSQLPEANEFTYGDGNRFYTLENAQDGYIVGHTYRTILSDGTYSWIDVDDYGATDTNGTAIVNYLAKSYTGKVVDTNGIVTSLLGWQFSGQKIEEAYFPNVSIIGASINNAVSMGGTFFWCSKLKKIYFPNLTSMTGSSMFQNCSALESAVFPNLAVVGVQNSTFYSCANLSYVEMPNVTHVFNSAFAKCSALKEFRCAGLTYVSNYAFESCKNLESVNFSTYSVFVSTRGFSNCGFSELKISCTSQVRFSDAAFANCRNLETVDITGSYIFLGYSSAFAGCSKLRNIRLDTSSAVTLIGSQMFLGCSSLKWGDLSSANITTISGRSIFRQCSALDCVYAPYLKTLSGVNIFSSCSSLSFIYAPTISIISGDATTFYDCYRLASVYIMQGSGLTELDIPTLSTHGIFSNSYDVGYYASGHHPWIYVGYEEYLPWLQSATNWVNISSWILVSQFVNPNEATE